MPDHLHLVPHPHEEKSYYELREQFRAENQARIQRMLRDHEVRRYNEKTGEWDIVVKTGFKVMGDTLGFSPEERGAAMLTDLNTRPVDQLFGLDMVPDYLIDKVEELSAETEVFDKVNIPGGVEHDAPACPPVETMTEQEICEYVDRAVEDSRGK
jgi:hypothetical protein